MSLSEKQKRIIRQIGIYRYADEERNGKAYYINSERREVEFVIPQFSEILQMMFEQIKERGFNQIKRCSPSRANCIIRVYQELHHEYEWGLCFNVYGAECYTKMTGWWITEFADEPYFLKFDKHCIRQNLMPDETIFFDTEFMDCYVEIS